MKPALLLLPVFLAVSAAAETPAFQPPAARQTASGWRDCTDMTADAVLRVVHPTRGALTVDLDSTLGIDEVLDEANTVCFETETVEDLRLLLLKLIRNTPDDEGMGLVRMEPLEGGSGYDLEISLSRDSSPWRFHWEGILEGCRE